MIQGGVEGAEDSAGAAQTAPEAEEGEQLTMQGVAVAAAVVAAQKQA